MSSSGNTGSGQGMTGKVSDAVNYVTESAKEMTSAGSKEQNKQEMKNDDKSMTDRASAGMSAVSDKMSQEGHSAKADAHKESTH